MARPKSELFPSWSWAGVMGGSPYVPYRISTSFYEHELKAKVAPPQSKEFLTMQGHHDSAGFIYDEMTQTDKFVKILFDTILLQHIYVVALLWMARRRPGNLETMNCAAGMLVCCLPHRSTWRISIEGSATGAYSIYGSRGLSKMDQLKTLIQHAECKIITLV